jgi:hypothetical protein
LLFHPATRAYLQRLPAGIELLITSPTADVISPNDDDIRFARLRPFETRSACTVAALTACSYPGEVFLPSLSGEPAVSVLMVAERQNFFRNRSQL